MDLTLSLGPVITNPFDKQGWQGLAGLSLAPSHEDSDPWETQTVGTITESGRFRGDRTGRSMSRWTPLFLCWRHMATVILKPARLESCNWRYIRLYMPLWKWTEREQLKTKWYTGVDWDRLRNPHTMSFAAMTAKHRFVAQYLVEWSSFIYTLECDWAQNICTWAPYLKLIQILHSIFVSWRVFACVTLCLFITEFKAGDRGTSQRGCQVTSAFIYFTWAFSPTLWDSAVFFSDPEHEPSSCAARCQFGAAVPSPCTDTEMAGLSLLPPAFVH